MSLSLNPNTFKNTSSLDGAVVTIRNPHFVLQEFDGDKPGEKQGRVSAALEYEIAGVDNTIPRNYGCGSPEVLVPSADGFTLEDAPGREGGSLNDQCAFAKFMKHLVDGGFPEDKITEDVRFLEGVQVQLVSVEETFKNLKDKKTGQPVKVTRELPKQYVGMVGTKGAGAVAGVPKSKSEAKRLEALKGAVAQDDEADAVKDAAVGFVLEQIGDGISKPSLMQKVQKVFAGKPELVKVLKLVSSDVFLKTIPGVKLEGGQLTIG